MNSSEPRVRVVSGISPVAKRHHYVPELYLRGFAAPRRKGHQTTVIDRSGRSFVTEIGNVAAETGFNRVAGDRPDVVEKALSDMETRLAESLQEIVLNRSLGSGERRVNLMHLIALLAIRNPRHRETIRKFHEDLARVVMDVSLASKERYEHQVRAMKKDGYSGGDIPYEEMRRFAEEKQYRIEVPTERHLALEFPSVETVVPYLDRRRWALLVTSKDAGEFVTSDHPVCLMWSNPKMRSGTKPPGFGLAGTEVVFTLSSNCALIGSFEIQDTVLADASEALVAKVNGIVCSYARRQVYARAMGFSYAFGDGAEHMRKGSRLSGDGNFRADVEEANSFEPS